ncbi:MAG: hypothetical protein ABIR96_09255 [Bdellovibrionota bacterium]
MKLFSRAIVYGLMATMLNACFPPVAETSGANGACAASDINVYGVWKQVRGYPSSWNYGGVNPSKTALADSYRLLMVERGGQMCSVAVIYQGVNADPNKSTVFRAAYSHDVEAKGLEIDYSYPTNAATQKVTYAITGCTSKPQLTLTYPDGREAVFEVWSRTISSGQCANY